MHRIQTVLNLFAALAILAMAVLVFVSVLFRYLLARPILMTEDLLTILLGLSIFAAFSRVTLYREHVSVDLMAAFFQPRPRLEALRRWIIDLLVLGTLGFIAFRLATQAIRYHARGNFTQTMGWPLWPVVALFAALLAIAVVLFAVQLCQEASRGRRETGAEGSPF